MSRRFRSHDLIYVRPGWAEHRSSRAENYSGDARAAAQGPDARGGAAPFVGAL